MLEGWGFFPEVREFPEVRVGGVLWFGFFLIALRRVRFTVWASEVARLT